MKRISFNKFEAEMLYEWFTALDQYDSFQCSCCPLIAKKLEKFIGKDIAKNTRKIVKKYPYYLKEK